MLAKLVLVVYLTAARTPPIMQYVVIMPSEEACRAEAKKINDAYMRKSWTDTTPTSVAQCTFNLTK